MRERRYIHARRPAACFANRISGLEAVSEMELWRKPDPVLSLSKGRAGRVALAAGGTRVLPPFQPAYGECMLLLHHHAGLPHEATENARYVLWQRICEF